MDDCLVPALHREGLSLSDIDWLLNTHCHGDHVGGHARIREMVSVPVATFSGSRDKLLDPLLYSRRIRAVFPRYSPPAPADLRGVTPDRLLIDGEYIAGRLRLIHTPGHDTDTVCWYDEPTSTLLSGDSLQANGTTLQGIGLIMDLLGYRESLKKLADMPIENIVAGHPYLPCGASALGRKAAERYLNTCIELVDFYDDFIGRALSSGRDDPTDIARSLIHEVGRPGARLSLSPPLHSDPIYHIRNEGNLTWQETYSSPVHPMESAWRQPWPLPGKDAMWALTTTAPKTAPGKPPKKARSLGVEAEIYQADVGRHEDCEAMIDAFIGHFRPYRRAGQ